VAESRFPMGIKFWGLLLLLALCLSQFFWRLGQAPFYTRGGAREGLVVWEMYKTGNWILPIINGDYIPFKPPFFHWIGVLISLANGRVHPFPLRAFDYGTIFYSRRHIPSYSPDLQNSKSPVFLLMWEEDWGRIRDRNDLQMLDMSEGRGPANEHRLVLVRSSRPLPMPDAQRILR
jgi:hypothetical protein